MSRLQKSTITLIIIAIIVLITMLSITFHPPALESFQNKNQYVDIEAKTNNKEVSSNFIIDSGSFIPQGKYIDIDMSIYSEEELELLNLILDKIEENKSSNKKTEIIKPNSNMDINSYHRVASYFYIYYGQSEAVTDVFKVLGYQNIFTGKNHFYIKLNYENIRNFENNIDKIKNKVDEILMSFEPGSDVYILRQISEYLRDNIKYVPGNHDIKSALIDGRATCNGYALAFNLLANRAGIKSDICITLMNDGIWHAWNKVSLSDSSEWFYDITYFDASNLDIYTHSQTPLHTTNYKLNSYTTAWFEE